jgi:hypothetical protein
MYLDKVQAAPRCPMHPARPDGELAFGLCDLGMGEPELGYVRMIELSTVRGKLGVPVERDLHFTAAKSISAYADEARAHSRIVT